MEGQGYPPQGFGPQQGFGLPQGYQDQQGFQNGQQYKKPNPLSYVLDLFRFRESRDQSRPHLQPIAARTGLLTALVMPLLLAAFIMLFLCLLSPSAFLRNKLYALRLCGPTCSESALTIGPWTTCLASRGQSTSCVGAIGYSWSSVIDAISPAALKNSLPQNEATAGPLLLISLTLTGLGMLLMAIASAEMMTVKRAARSGEVSPLEIVTHIDRGAHLNV
jgi:hypothetical protein